MYLGEAEENVGQWSEIISAAVQVGTKAYEAKVQKDIAKKQAQSAQTQALLEQRAQQAALAAQHARTGGDKGFFEKYGVVVMVGAGLIAVPLTIMYFMKKKEQAPKAA